VRQEAGVRSRRFGARKRKCFWMLQTN